MKQRRVIDVIALLTVLYGVAVEAAQLEAEVLWTVPLTLATTLESQVIESKVKVGQQVGKGELLLQLDDEVAKARLAEARAELNHRKLMLAEAKSELQRSEELYERTMLSDHDLVVARIGHADAQSRYSQANRAVVEARRELTLTQITAPFDAIVVQRHVRPGETVNGRFTQVPLISLVEAKRQRVVVALTAEQAASLSPGGELAVEAGGKRYSGRVEGLLSRAGKGSETVELELLFTIEKPLARGAPVTVMLP